MATALAGRRIALAEGRQLEELAAMLTREGAEVLRCPMVSILDVPDPAPVLAWLGDLTAGRIGLLILMTGEGVRRLLGFADRAGMRADVVVAIGRTRTISRGPKPVMALREIGLTASIIAAVPTTDGVLTSLMNEQLDGVSVGVQLYREKNRPLEDFLCRAGATVRCVLPYIYAPAADSDRVADLIHRLANGEVAMVVFTSSPQVDRLYEVAAEKGLTEQLGEGLRRSLVAAVGPVVAETLRVRRIQIDVCPEQGFVMKNLVVQIKRHFEKGAMPG